MLKLKPNSAIVVGNLKNAILYFGGSIIQLFVSIFTSPVFARNLESTDFAIIGYYASIGSFIMPLSTLSLTFYYLMKYFRQGQEENQKLFSSLIVFLTYYNIIVLSLSYGALAAYFYLGKVSMPFYPFSLLTLSSIFLEIYKSFILLNYRVKKKAFNYFVFSSVLVILSTSLSLLFVVKFKGGACGKMAGYFVALFLVTAFVIYSLRKSLTFKIDLKIIKEGLKFSYPMLISAYFYIPIASIDKIFLERLNNLNEFGYYNIGFNIANYLGVAGLALGQAFEPDFFKYVIEKNRKKFFINAAVYSLILIVATGIFILFSKFLVGYLTSGRYTRAYNYANLNAIAILIMNLSEITNAVILAQQKPKYMLVVNIISGTIGILIFKICIDKWEFTGANYGRILVASLYLTVQLLMIAFRNHSILRKLS